MASNFKTKEEKNPNIGYFTTALYAKWGLGLSFGLFYMLMGNGGDTAAYFDTAKSLNRLLFHDPAGWFEQMTSGPSSEMLNRLFDIRNTGYPKGWIYREEASLFVAKLYSFLGLITFNSYWASSLITGYIVTKASWKLYELALRYEFHKPRTLAIGVLFLPSVGFWCAGVGKDSVIFICTIYALFHLLKIITPGFKSSSKDIIYALVFLGLISQIRGFMLVAILIPIGLSYFSSKLRALQFNEGAILGVYIIFTVFAIGASSLFITAQGGTEVIENSSIMQEAKVVQKDFTENKTYGKNRYSLGEIEYTPIGIIKKAPLSVITGIYRPFLWESLSPSLIFNGLESMFVIYFSLIFIFQSPWQKIKTVTSDEFLMFCLVFVVMIAFLAGFTSILFGVLVRIRAPLLPFLFIILTIDWSRFIKKKAELEERVMVFR